MLITNVLNKETYHELKALHASLPSGEEQAMYGRMHQGRDLPDSILKAIETVVAPLSDQKLYTHLGAQFVTYSKQYGVPNLPPHFDGDDTEFLFNYQLDSNVSWPLGLNTEAFKMRDNDVVIIRPNRDIHWRPMQTFQDGEYVTMVFVRFRFEETQNPDKYAHMRKSLDDPIFDDAYAYRKVVSDPDAEYDYFAE